MSLPPGERYEELNQVLWNRVFYKTFKENRGWSHVLVNFHRVWIIHSAVFWYYTAFNSPTLYTKNYQPALDNQPTTQARLSVLAFGVWLPLLLILSVYCSNYGLFQENGLGLNLLVKD